MIDAQFDELKGMLQGMSQQLEGMDARFEGIDARFDGIDERFRGIDARLDEQTRALQATSHHLTSRLINFEGRVEERFSALSEQLRTVETGMLNEIRLQATRTTRVEERLSGLEGAA